MKQLVTILAASLLLLSCEPFPNETKHIEQKHYKLDLPYTDCTITEYTIDGCQYIGHIGGDSRSNYITHKGNCTNPIHNK
jgi:hypothetical protein